MCNDNNYINGQFRGAHSHCPSKNFNTLSSIQNSWINNYISFKINKYTKKYKETNNENKYHINDQLKIVYKDDKTADKKNMMILIIFDWFRKIIRCLAF